MKSVLTYILTHIVDHPEDVSLEERVEEGRTVFIVSAHQEDIGKIIGKKGRIIMAIRDLVKLIAAKQNTYVDITIADDVPAEVK